MIGYIVENNTGSLSMYIYWGVQSEPVSAS